jgi:hypothetical protein
MPLAWSCTGLNCTCLFLSASRWSFFYASLIQFFIWHNYKFCPILSSHRFFLPMFPDRFTCGKYENMIFFTIVGYLLVCNILFSYSNHLSPFLRKLFSISVWPVISKILSFCYVSPIFTPMTVLRHFIWKLWMRRSCDTILAHIPLP